MSGAERLSASDAAARLEAGSLTAETLARDCLERAEARARGQGLGVARSRAGARPGARRRSRRAAWSAEGPSGRGQGRDRHLRHADPARLADLPRQPALCRRCLRGADPRGGRGHPRQDGDDRIRQPPAARDRASAEPGAYARRLVERLGRGGRRFPGPGRLRHANRRLDDPPGRVLRRHRLQALLRRVQPGRHQDAVPQSRYVGHYLPQPRRYLSDARRIAGAAPPQGRPLARRAAHRLLPHPLLGSCQPRHPSLARAHRLAARRRRRGRDRGGAGSGQFSRAPAPGLRLRGGAQLRLGIRGAWRQIKPGPARRPFTRRTGVAARHLHRGDRSRRSCPRRSRRCFRGIRRAAGAERGRRSARGARTRPATRASTRSGPWPGRRA